MRISNSSMVDNNCHIRNKLLAYKKKITTKNKQSEKFTKKSDERFYKIKISLYLPGLLRLAPTNCSCINELEENNTKTWLLLTRQIKSLTTKCGWQFFSTVVFI